MNWPSVPSGSRWLLGAAALTWLGVGVGQRADDRQTVAAAVLSVTTAWLWRSRLPLVLLPALAVTALSAASVGSEPWQPGSEPIAVELSSDVVPGRWGGLAFGSVEPDGPLIALRFDDEPEAVRGDLIVVTGRSDAIPAVIMGRSVAGTVRVDRIEAHAPATGPLLRSANALRSRIVEQLDVRRSNGRALLAGFLIGDVSAVDRLVLEDLRRSGLSHLVAVSGSNVALFLGLWWVVTAPLSMSPRFRAVVGGAGLVLFGHLTRWEPSVVRASAMALVVLVGRTIGLVLDGWSALSLAVIGSLWWAPELASSLGFQLSVAATLGILGAPRVDGAALRAMTATAAAQVAVTPILLGTVGSVPLFSPLANLVAIPVVGVTTVVAGLGALVGASPAIAFAEIGADIVIGVGRIASGLPQIGWWGSIAAVVGLAAVMIRPVLRPLLAMTLAVVLGFSVMPLGARVDRPAVVFLDVGQGDAALVLAHGFTVLIDGGPDGQILESKLVAYGVDRLDLVVATHVHADHLTGLAEVLDRRPVGVIWEAFDPHETRAARELRATAEGLSIPMVRPAVGETFELGSTALEVAGPLRRYASPNDQSIVLVVDVEETRFLFAGDIETFAQAEIDVAGVDVLKVPHQGAATSDAGWLHRHAGSLAVISVGPNDFGHPAEWVVTALEEAGADVGRTDRDGDVVVEVPFRDERRRRSPGRLRPARRQPARLRGA